MIRREQLLGSDIYLPEGACGYKVEITSPTCNTKFVREGETGYLGSIEMGGGGKSTVQIRAIVVEHKARGKKGESGHVKVRVQRYLIDPQGKEEPNGDRTQTIPDGGRWHVAGSTPEKGIVIWHDQEHWESGTVPY